MDTTRSVMEVRGLCVPPYQDSGAQLHPVDFELRRGEVLALLGLDTGGLTMLVDAVLGLHRQAEGEARILGLPVRDPRALDRIGTVRRQVGFPTTLTVREVIELIQEHYSRTPPVDELLERFAMASAGAQRIGDLSRPQCYWLAILLAFAGDPELVLLDHPTVGMDLRWRDQFWELMRDFADRGGAALVVTHLTDDVESAADRVIAFVDGKAVAHGIPDEITAASQVKRVRFLAGQTPNGNSDGLEFVRRGDYWCVDCPDPDRVIEQLERDGIEWEDLRVDAGDLRSALLQFGEVHDAR